MATIEYNVPVHHHRARKVTYETRKGRVAWLNVGAEYYAAFKRNPYG